MKSGIFIRVGIENKDLVDTTLYELGKWWNTLEKGTKLRTVRMLLERMRGIDIIGSMM